MRKSLWYGMQVALIAIGLVACNQLDQITNTEDQNQQQNTAPTAVAGSDQSVSIGDTVTVNGSASTDVDGDSLTYQWTLQSKPTGSSASLQDANKAKAWFIADVSGTYTLRLTVSDGTDSDSDDLTVTAEVQTLGDINENTTLHDIFDDPAQADYVVTGVSNVNAVLTIEPGVTIEFGTGARMDVESGGTLKAIGTETDSIFFIGANESPGGWDGINFISNKVDNKLSYAAILYGGADSYANVSVGYQGGVTLSHIRSDFSSTYGLDADDGAVLRNFAENSFNANTKGGLNIPGNLIGSLDAASSYKGTNGQGIISVYSSNVDVAQTWPAADAPYIMDGVTNVNAAVAVKPGAIFKFTQSARMDIEEPNGSLAAVGTADSLIQFLGTQATAGYWAGLNFLDNNLANELTYVKVSHGGADSYANVSLNYVAGVKITHSQFTTSSTYGLDVDSGGGLREFTGNTFASDAIVHIPAYLMGSLDGASSYIGDGSGYIAVYGDDINTDQTWPATDAPFRVDGVVNIYADVDVTPGATVEFNSSARVDIDNGANGGSLKAVGTSVDSIKFIGANANHTQGYWDGLYFMTNTSSNQLQYCVVANGGFDSYADVAVSYSGSVSVTNSTLRDSKTYGIEVDSGGGLTQSGNAFSNNLLGDVMLH